MTFTLKSLATVAVAAVLASPALAAGVRPDDRSTGPRSQPTTESLRPDDRPGTRGPGPVEYAIPSSPVGTDFDLGDAAIGAAAGAGVVLLLAGTTLVLLRRRAQLSV